MLRQLDRLDARIRSSRADDHAGPLERLDVGGVEPEAAVVEAVERLGAADRREARAGHRRDDPHLADEAAGEPTDDRIDGVRVALLVSGVVIPARLRATSTSACWNPPQVPRNGVPVSRQ